MFNVTAQTRNNSWTKTVDTLERAEALKIEWKTKYKAKIRITPMLTIEKPYFPCPDSKEIQNEKRRESGAEWNSEMNCYLYSASY